MRSISNSCNWTKIDSVSALRPSTVNQLQKLRKFVDILESVWSISHSRDLMIFERNNRFIDQRRRKHSITQKRLMSLSSWIRSNIICGSFENKMSFKQKRTTQKKKWCELKTERERESAWKKMKKRRRKWRRDIRKTEQIHRHTRQKNVSRKKSKAGGWDSNNATTV